MLTPLSRGLDSIISSEYSSLSSGSFSGSISVVIRQDFHYLCSYIPFTLWVSYTAQQLPNNFSSLVPPSSVSLSMYRSPDRHSLPTPTLVHNPPLRIDEFLLWLLCLQLVRCFERFHKYINTSGLSNH